MIRQLIAFAACVIATACVADAATPSRGQPLASSLRITPAPRTAPTASSTYSPGAASIVGTLRAIGSNSIVVGTVDDGDVVVDLAVVRDVWRETSVDAAALKIGDDLFISGDRTSGGIRALYVYANIGRVDGVILGIDGGSMRLAPLRLGMPVATVVTVGISPYLRADSLTLADVKAGDTIGAVVYYERDTGGQIALRRITKMWR